MKPIKLTKEETKTLINLLHHAFNHHNDEAQTYAEKKGNQNRVNMIHHATKAGIASTILTKACESIGGDK